MTTSVSAGIDGKQAYAYRCYDHPECGSYWHVITSRQLKALPEPEYFFVASHIPEFWDEEWDWANPEWHEGKE